MSESNQAVPLISVVLPAHNRAHCIGRAIDSVLAQRFADFELIVVDDGSKDRTAAVARAYRDPRVRVIALDGNRGSNAARNAGIAAAKGEIIAFLDSDDAFLPHKLGFVAAEFARRPELDVLVDSYIVQFPDERPDQQRFNPLLEGEAFIEALYRRWLWKATPAISARREAVERAGAFDESVQRRQDFDFLARAARVAYCAASDQLLWIKSWSAGAISSRPEKFIGATIELCRRHPDYVSDKRFFRGLARDVTRQLTRLVRARRFGDARRDVRRLRREFGIRGTLRLLGLGWWESSERRRLKRVSSSAGARAMSRTLPLPSLSPGEQASAPAAARNRESARS